VLARAAAVALVVAAGAASPTGIAALPTTGATCSVGGALHSPPSNLPRYTLSVHVRKALRVVTGTQSVRFTPESATDRLVFRLWANEPYLAQKGAKLTVGSVRSHGKALPVARPNPTTLVVHRALRAGERIVVSTKWRLRLPVGSFDRLYGGSLARLGSFFPLLAWDPRAGWQTDPPSAIGWETWSSPAADFDVRVAAPRGLRVLASGTQIARAHWQAHAIRDFALAVGRFTVVTGTAAAPDRVRLKVGVERGTRTFARRLLAEARAAVEAHAQRFGPYPWPTVTVVASDMGRFGWEYPTIVFVSANGPDLPAAVEHELGHQWFYSLVGNNQVRDPWLDEALTTWAQVRFADDSPESWPLRSRSRSGASSGNR
jgi:Peptidase family M1 domain